MIIGYANDETGVMGQQTSYKALIGTMHLMPQYNYYT